MTTQIRWRLLLAREAVVLAWRLAGDWWCYTFHLNTLCRCGREWHGNCCVSRSWKEDLDALVDGYDKL